VIGAAIGVGAGFLIAHVYDRPEGDTLQVTVSGVVGGAVGILVAGRPQVIYRSPEAEATASVPTPLVPEAAAGWQALATQIAPGDSVFVTNAAGVRTKVKVAEVNGSSIEGDRSSANVQYHFPAGDVTRIERADSLANGMVFGLLVGVGVGALSSSAGCGGDGSCSAAQMAAFIPIFGGAGLVIGALLDREFTTTIYGRPQGRSVTIAPVVSRKAIGVHVALRF
jgi:hypothetical protein